MEDSQLFLVKAAQQGLVSGQGHGAGTIMMGHDTSESVYYVCPSPPLLCYHERCPGRTVSVELEHGEIAMKRESPKVDRRHKQEQEKNRRKKALDVLLAAREQLLAQMTEEVISNSDVILEGSSIEGMSSFELEEIEDRYSARLNALNSLLENLENRRPSVRHRIESLKTTAESLEKDLADLLSELEQWDLVDMAILPREGEQLLCVVALTADEYPE